MDVWHLFLAMLRAGLLGYGGGPASIPLIKAEVVERYQWFSDQDFTDALAMANSLPGPIATKLAAFVGYKVAGVSGVLSALLGMVGPTAIAVVVLVKVLTVFKDSPYLKGLIAGVRPVVVVLLLQVAYQATKGSFPDWKPYAIAGIAAIALFWLKIDAPWVIVGAMVIGAFFLKPSIGL